MPEQTSTLNLRYTLKAGARDGLLAELQIILDFCAKKPEFICAILQETPDRPDELLLFELWRGTREDFARVQGPEAYRKEYVERSKPYWDKVEAVFSTPFAEWGMSLRSRHFSLNGGSTSE